MNIRQKCKKLKKENKQLQTYKDIVVAYTRRADIGYKNHSCDTETLASEIVYPFGEFERIKKEHPDIFRDQIIRQLRDELGKSLEVDTFMDFATGNVVVTGRLIIVKR